MKKTAFPFVFFFFLLITAVPVIGQSYLWRGSISQHTGQTVADIDPPPGYTRLPTADTSFAFWLRHLPLKKAGSPVKLYNGQPNRSQAGQYRVIDIDVGTTNLQQCADAIMRLRAEYLYSRHLYTAVHFNFTSGDICKFTQWSKGYRPRIDGNRVTWEKKAEPDSSYRSFRAYLTTVFTYAGSYSLSREMVLVARPDNIAPGDVFIHGGFPGHAVIVVEMAINTETGQKIFLLAQSYMPAQDIHILKNLQNRKMSPWYEVDSADRLFTPDCTFEWSDLKRFRE